MKPEGRSAEEIVANPIIDHSSWHFFQAKSWLDFATRTQLPSALHYAAFELRYGIEYLLFELLVTANRNLTEAQYQKCLSDKDAIKKMLRSAEVGYDRLVEFTRILFSLDPNSPPLRYWKLKDLLKYWGIASETLHFCGSHRLTYGSGRWIIARLARLEGVCNTIWDSSRGTIGSGLLRRSTMPEEVRQAYDEFTSGRLTESDLRIRMRLIQPILQERMSRTSAFTVSASRVTPAASAPGAPRAPIR